MAGGPLSWAVRGGSQRPARRPADDGADALLRRRALDGARAAQFLGTLADLLEEPLSLLT